MLLGLVKFHWVRKNIFWTMKSKIFKLRFKTFQAAWKPIQLVTSVQYNTKIIVIFTKHCFFNILRCTDTKEKLNCIWLQRTCKEQAFLILLCHENITSLKHCSFKQISSLSHHVSFNSLYQFRWFYNHVFLS